MPDKKLKLLFLTHAAAPGGAEFKLLHLATFSQQQANLSPHILLFTNGKTAKLLDNKNLSYDICFNENTNTTDVQRNASTLEILKKIPFFAKIFFKIIKQAKQHDILVPMSQKSFVLAALAKPLHRKPIIWYMNDLLSKTDFSGVMIKLQTVLAKRFADHVVFNSKASLQAWQQHGGHSKNIHVHYPGIDIDTFQQQLEHTVETENYRQKFSPNNKKTVGIIGRISEWKGQHIFVEAIAKLPNVRGIIIGEAFDNDQDYKQQLLQQVRDLGIEDRILFTGHIDTVPNAMAACDAIAHCSTSPEPFGQVIVQGLLASKPVIATKGGGVEEILAETKNSIMVPPNEVLSLIKALKHALKSKSQASEVKLEKFDIKNFNENFKYLIELSSKYL